MFDLDAYLSRVGYDGPRAPTLALLRDLTAAHTQSIPFENLDVLLGRRIVLGIDAVFDKLVRQRRGGYCFEQNGLFLHVLTALGFEARPLSARVRIDRPRDETPPRTHMFLRVEIDGASWLTDVGVGALSLTAPLRLMDGASVQETPHEPRRLVREGEWQGLGLRSPGAKLYHQVLLDDSWQDICELTLEEMPEIDRVLGNWYTSAYPASHFKDRLLVALATERGRKTLLNRRFTRRQGERAEVRELATPDELCDVLAGEFGIRLPAGTRLDCAGLDWPAKG